MVFGKKKEVVATTEVMVLEAGLKRTAELDLSDGTGYTVTLVVEGLSGVQLDRLVGAIQDNGMIGLTVSERDDGSAAHHSKH